MKIALIALDEVVATSIAGIIDYFNFANLIARDKNLAVTVTLYSPQGSQIKTSMGVSIPCEQLSNLGIDNEVIWFLGSRYRGSENLILESQSVSLCKTSLNDAINSAQIVAGSCTGVALMLACITTLPDTITTSWWLRRFFSKHYPGVELMLDKPIVRSGKFITAGATHCFQALVFFLVERHFGRDVLLQLKKWLVIPDIMVNQEQFIDLNVLDLHAGKRLHPVVQFIRTNLGGDLSNESLANVGSMSVRNLIRTFKLLYGMTPSKYVLIARLEAAIHEIKASPHRKLYDIAYEVGYQDVSAFSRQFQKHFGFSASSLKHS
ncbi:GlxA family transcriptional regulator [Pseudoalteromonas xiamenensis]